MFEDWVKKQEEDAESALDELIKQHGVENVRCFERVGSCYVFNDKPYIRRAKVEPVPAPVQEPIQEPVVEVKRKNRGLGRLEYQPTGNEPGRPSLPFGSKIREALAEGVKEGEPLRERVLIVAAECGIKVSDDGAALYEKAMRIRRTEKNKAKRRARPKEKRRNT
jgi:hypothetical protein